jgi:2-methylisocitrate lyase-like PEP mutase family enzyme
MANSKYDKIRKLSAPGAGTMVPGAHSALSARIIQDAGFEAVLFTGAGFANSYLGVPDMGLTSLTEVVDQIAAICDAVDIPVIADGDTGFGNALNTRRAVRLFERAGASAMLLEDQVYPKRCGHFENKSVVSKSEMVQKLKAAVDARQQGMLIFARTDARAMEGLDGAIDRAHAYLEAGADLLFIEAPQSMEELERIPKAVPAPHLCNMVYGGKTPIPSQEALAKMGYSIICYANAALQASMLAMSKVMKHLQVKGSLEGMEDSVIPFMERQKFVDYSRYVAMEQKYKSE